jgi:toxin ParE1/3/4
MPVAKVAYAPEAEAQLLKLYRAIAEKASPATAQRFTDSILDYCDGLGDLPLKGVARDDLRLGLRTFSIRRRVTIAYGVSAKTITILGIYYGGRDLATLLKDD